MGHESRQEKASTLIEKAVFSRGLEDLGSFQLKLEKIKTTVVSASPSC